MTRESAKLQAWTDWHGAVSPDLIPAAPPAFDRGFDCGWSAAIRAVAAALTSAEDFDRLISEDAT